MSFCIFSTLLLTWGPDGVQGALQNAPEVVFKWFGHHFLSFLDAFRHSPQEKKHGGGIARLRTGYAAPVPGRWRDNEGTN